MEEPNWPRPRGEHPEFDGRKLAAPLLDNSSSRLQRRSSGAVGRRRQLQPLRGNTHQELVWRHGGAATPRGATRSCSQQVLHSNFGALPRGGLASQRLDGVQGDGDQAAVEAGGGRHGHQDGVAARAAALVGHRLEAARPRRQAVPRALAEPLCRSVFAASQLIVSAVGPRPSVASSGSSEGPAKSELGLGLRFRLWLRLPPSILRFSYC